MLKVAAGINLLHVPYKGAGPAITDVVAGQVHMMFAQPGTVLGQVSTNRMRAIAMNGDQRWSGMPNVPTFAEAGVAGMETSSIWQVMVPAATPAAGYATLPQSPGIGFEARPELFAVMKALVPGA